MPQFDTNQIRNVVVVGHRGCGKTTIAEGLLYTAGATDRLGRVDEGTSTCDFEPEEIDRKISISPALAYCEHNQVKINLIDTPGYAEFFGEVLPCLWVADCALLVVDGIAGVEVHTHKVYQVARQMQLPVVAVINKIDKERSDFAAAVSNLRDALGGMEVVPVQVPVGSQASFAGVIDLLSMKAIVGQGPQAKRQDIPTELRDEAAVARENLIDAVAATDDELTIKYLEEGELTAEELASGLKEAVGQGTIMPVLAVGAYQTIGLTALLDFIGEVCPSPADRGPWRGTDSKDQQISREVSDSEPFSAVVFKTLSDPYVGRLSLLRVVSGVAQADADVINADNGSREKLSGLSFVQGRKTISAGTLAAGDLGCVTKLENTLTGDTLCETRAQVVFAAPESALGMHSAALQVASQADQDKLSQALSRLAEEDVGFTYERDPDTGELVAHSMGPLHIEIVTGRLKRKFEVDVSLSEPKIPYRETVRRKVRVQGRHKKQTGGRGQFGDVWIRVEPLPCGGGFEFVNEIKGGAVPTNYIAAVEKGIKDAMEDGVLARYPVTDVRVILDDGSSHPVDSSDQAFRMAGQIAMRMAIQEASPVLLEPIVEAEVATPEDIMGDIMSDLNARRGQIQGTESLGGQVQVIRALVPLGEMSTYAATLRSISQGRASYAMQFAHYQQMPAQLAETIIAKAQGS